MSTLRPFLARVVRSISAHLRSLSTFLKRISAKQHKAIPSRSLHIFQCLFTALPFLLIFYIFNSLSPVAQDVQSPQSRSSQIINSLPDTTASKALLPNVATTSPLFDTVAPRPSLQRYSPSLPVTNSQHPTIHLIFACDTHQPCSHDSYSDSLRAALSQSLSPTQLTVFHACDTLTHDHPDSFVHAVRRVVADTLGDIIYDQPVSSSESFIRFHACHNSSNHSKHPVNMELCILRHLFSPSQHPPVHDAAYIALVTPSTVLEPTALESLWLYLFLRPQLFAAHPLSYSNSSPYREANASIPPITTAKIPSSHPHDNNPVQPLPLVLSRSALTSNKFDEKLDDSRYWALFAKLITKSRLVRIPLYSYVLSNATALSRGTNGSTSVDSLPLTPEIFPTLALRRELFPSDELHPHLWSELSYYRWSAREDSQEKYNDPLFSEDEKNGFDFWAMPFRKVYFSPELNNNPRFMFIMPWIQMGGSEKCMLDIAHRLIEMKWPITFVLTMPFWGEDSLGELSLQNEWLYKALELTPDVFDIVNLSQNAKFTKTLRYLLESRSPDYILTGNSRIIYEHLAFIKAVSPKTVIADYNHMVHMSWEVIPGKGGGMPRYAAVHTKNIDVHLTASDNVTSSINSWIDADVVKENPKKVQTCYIGTNSSVLHSETERPNVRARMRKDFGIEEDVVVVLFAGRYVSDKGIDVMGEVVRRVANEDVMSSKLAFVFVGSGDQGDMLESTAQRLGNSNPKMFLRPPATGISELRDYYAMADIFLLPSNNEGIALVLYEAMAAGLLVMSTDVGGQKELIQSNTGVLLPLLPDAYSSALFIVRQLEAIVKFAKMFKDIQRAGTAVVRSKYTTEKFCDCVLRNMIKAKQVLDRHETELSPEEETIEKMRPALADVMRVERIHGMWNQRQVDRSIERVVTVGIKTYVCDDSIVRQVLGLVRSIRVNYPTVRILLANDGPTRLGSIEAIAQDAYTEEIVLPPDSGISVGRNLMVNMTTTEFFVLLDDDHVFDDDTDLKLGVKGLGHGFDIVGIRVRNLPGIDELERISIFIPRYVSRISKFENREVTLCVWNENNGPGVQKMKVPIRVDVLHNALIARRDILAKHPWRDELKVNEHMTFFLDARKAGVRVGYLPSVFVHHRARRYSECYKTVRFREDKYEGMLEYKDEYLWDVECGDNFPAAVAKHLEETQDDE